MKPRRSRVDELYEMFAFAREQNQKAATEQRSAEPNRNFVVYDEAADVTPEQWDDDRWRRRKLAKMFGMFNFVSTW